MELRDLRTLVAIVRCGSFTAAARQLGYTQSAVSQQLAALEQEVGHQLVSRRPVRATPAGERLVEHAARILLRVEVAESELRSLGGDATALRISACPLAAPDVLAAALRQLRSSEPMLQVTVASADGASAVRAVTTAASDVALVEGVSAPGEPLHLADAGLLTSVPIGQAPVVVLLPAGHPLSRAPSIDLAALADAPFVVAPPAAPSTRSAGVQYDGRDLATLAALVAAGLGLASLPAPRCAGLQGVTAVRLRDPPLVHRSEALVLRTVGSRARSLLEALRARADFGVALEAASP